MKNKSGRSSGEGAAPRGKGKKGGIAAEFGEESWWNGGGRVEPEAVGEHCGPEG